MVLTEGQLNREGYRVHYWSGGKAGAPLVVFSHGATIDHHEWDDTLAGIGQYFRVVAWDMPGHGQSRPTNFSVDEAVACLLAILDAFDAKDAILVGHSAGGNLSQEFAFRHAERVRAMVGLGCTWNFQKLNAMETMLVRAAGPMLKAFPYKSLIQQVLTASAISEHGREVLKKGMEQLSQSEFIQITVGVTSFLHYEPGYVIGKPLLLMMGDQEKTGNIAKAMPAWAAVEPNCKFITIPNARHAANLDNPEFFHKHLSEFLAAQA
jgi:pimeloyl-ACP methyl ester carboxylesterase